jgi:hypothetical protein
MDDGQKTPRGHPNFDSYVKILLVFVFRTDGRTERQTDRQRNCSGVGFPHYVPPGTPAARGLEELFSDVLERFLKPIHALPLYCKN